jgi:signal transduction histidine kinase
MLKMKAPARPRSAFKTFLISLVCWNPLIAGALTYVFGGPHDFFRSWLIALVISDVVAVECFLGIQAIVRLERTLWRRKGADAPKRSRGFHFLTAAGLMPLALPIGLQVGASCARLMGVPWSTPDGRVYRISIAFGLAITALFFFQRAQSDARDAARNAEARIRELENHRLCAQLAALAAEMNPHLLFNALNTVAALVHSDPDRAEEVVLELAELYRSVLRSARLVSHTLTEELALCEGYLKLERARFGDRLSFAVDVAPEVDSEQIQVPVLLLQPFVENAIKHGIATRSCPGEVRLEVRLEGMRVCAVVDDNGVGFGQSPHRGAGKAIANCRDRLSLTYGDSAGLTVGPRHGGGTRVCLSFPLTGNFAGNLTC